MQYDLIDLIACPMCRGNSFSKSVIREEGDNVIIPGHGEHTYTDSNNDGANHDMKNGILLCNTCGRWYPIINSIHILLPDTYRDEKKDMEFLTKYKSDLPDIVINNGKPFNIKALEKT